MLGQTVHPPRAEHFGFVALLEPGHPADDHDIVPGTPRARQTAKSVLHATVLSLRRHTDFTDTMLLIQSPVL